MENQPIIGVRGRGVKLEKRLIFIYMIIQGTSAKIHFIPIGVYLAILIINIKESVKFWERGGVRASN